MFTLWTRPIHTKLIGTIHRAIVITNARGVWYDFAGTITKLERFNFCGAWQPHALYRIS